jgi:hypothetical protein
MTIATSTTTKGQITVSMTSSGKAPTTVSCATTTSDANDHTFDSDCGGVKTFVYNTKGDSGSVTTHPPFGTRATTTTYTRG